MSKDTSERKKLVGGVAVLMPAALFTKVVGLFYKIPLITIVGVTGMAYFLAAYHVYSVVFVLSAAGLPTVLSLLISRAMATDRRRTAHRILAVALLLFLTVGVGGTAALVWLAPVLSRRLAMADAAAAIVAIAPALALSAFVGAAKGYFQGLQRMLPTALSEVLEALGKLCFGLWFALLAKGRGAPAPIVAAYAIFGITAGLAVAALVLAVLLLIHLIRHRPARDEIAPPRRRTVLRELCRVALPITVNSLVMSVATLIDTALISRRLQAAGFAPAAADALYSAYGNLAMPLYNLVPALLTPVTLALMPLLGAAASGGRPEKGRGALVCAIRLTALIAVPAALGLAVFARPLLCLIYGRGQSAIEPAAPLLSLLALSILPVALITLLGAALQALGHTVLPVVAMTVGAALKLGIESVLLVCPSVYIHGAPISTLCCNAVVLLIEATALARVLPFRFFSPRMLLGPMLAALPAVGGGALLYFGLLSALPTADWIILPSLALTVAVYGLLALRFGAVGREELSVLPFGERLCTVLEKCRLMRTKK
ncbi:MAG: oligosaccharide flippase family protein [Clostridia bacterium]|nr:oligosaccharide flippase family protein [Clostridia bacterium]